MLVRRALERKATDAVAFVFRINHLKIQYDTVNNFHRFTVYHMNYVHDVVVLLNVVIMVTSLIGLMWFIYPHSWKLTRWYCGIVWTTGSAFTHLSGILLSSDFLWEWIIGLLTKDLIYVKYIFLPDDNLEREIWERNGSKENYFDHALRRLYLRRHRRAPEKFVMTTVTASRDGKASLIYIYVMYNSVPRML